MALTGAAEEEADERAPCPVCRAAAVRPFATLGGRRYRRCGACEATLLDPRHWLAPAEEAAVYRLHENDPDDPGYRRFLAKLSDPLLARLPAGAAVLDYGCGPGSALAAVLREAGHRVALYDPFFAPDPAPLDQRYDAVVCSEAAEHFHAPAAEFDRLAGRLAPGGWLGVMTCFQTDDARFAGWHYRQDPTHVVFYREATLRRLAAQRGLSCEVPAKDVALMRRAPLAPDPG